MTRPPTISKNDDAARHKALAALLIVAGVGVISISFVWPTRATQRRAWSLEQAKQYQAASSKLHGLLHEKANAQPGRDVTVRKQLDSAKAEYDALRRDLDSAMSRPQRWAWMLRLGGMLAVFLGGVLLFTLPKDREHE
jgi:hypothetical protein